MLRTLTANVVRDTAVVIAHVSTVKNCPSVQKARSWLSLVTKETQMTLKGRVQYKWVVEQQFPSLITTCFWEGS